MVGRLLRPRRTPTPVARRAKSAPQAAPRNLGRDRGGRCYRDGGAAILEAAVRQTCVTSFGVTHSGSVVAGAPCTMV